MDGVLIDSEAVWADVRRRFTLAHDGDWPEGTEHKLMGMSSPEWAAFMHDDLHVQMDPDEITAAVVDEMAERYRKRVPLLPGAVDAVARLAGRWPLGLASSANRPLIDLALSESGLERYFAATVSSEEVERGKPAPDVYVEAARRLAVDPSEAVAVEDSHNGILAAVAAGMHTIAIPNPAFPPGDDALAAADEVLGSIRELAV